MCIVVGFSSYLTLCWVSVNLKELFLSHHSSKQVYLVCKLETTAQGWSISTRCNTLFQRAGAGWRGTATRIRTGQVLVRLSSNGLLQMLAPMCRKFYRMVRTVSLIFPFIIHSCNNFTLNALFKQLWCQMFAVSSMQRMITQIGTPQDNQQLQNQLWDEWNLYIALSTPPSWSTSYLSCSFSFDCYVCRHQIQHYTGQLAKDTSSQLKELNSYPPEQALDPRCISWGCWQRCWWWC